MLTICFLVFWPQVSLGRDAPLANEDKPGLYARSIEQVLRLSEDEVDLATAALIISEQWSDMVEGRRYLSTLDDMALEIRDRLSRQKLRTNFRAIPVINKYLFDELGFQSISEANDPNDLFLHSVLDKKQGYCLSLSILYLSLPNGLVFLYMGWLCRGIFSSDTMMGGQDSISRRQAKAAAPPMSTTSINSKCRKAAAAAVFI